MSVGVIHANNETAVSPISKSVCGFHATNLPITRPQNVADLLASRLPVISS